MPPLSGFHLVEAVLGLVINANQKRDCVDFVEIAEDLFLMVFLCLILTREDDLFRAIGLLQIAESSILI